MQKRTSYQGHLRVSLNLTNQKFTCFGGGTRNKPLFLKDLNFSKYIILSASNREDFIELGALCAKIKGEQIEKGEEVSFTPR
jgi:hypothetical protein